MEKRRRLGCLLGSCWVRMGMQWELASGICILDKVVLGGGGHITISLAWLTSSVPSFWLCFAGEHCRLPGNTAGPVASRPLSLSSSRNTRILSPGASSYPYSATPAALQGRPRSFFFSFFPSVRVIATEGQGCSAEPRCLAASPAKVCPVSILRGQCLAPHTQFWVVCLVSGSTLLVFARASTLRSVETVCQ